LIGVICTVFVNVEWITLMLFMNGLAPDKIVLELSSALKSSF